MLQREKGLVMQIIKINDLNEYLKPNAEYPSKIIEMKKGIEQILQRYAPTINIELDMKLNLIVDGDDYGICFDEMALLEPLKKLLGINPVESAIGDNKKELILGSIPARISELKKTQMIEQLTYQFPALHDRFLRYEQTVKQTKEIEEYYSRIKPVEKAMMLKKKNMYQLGKNYYDIHQHNCKVASAFGLPLFISVYASEIEQLHNSIEFILEKMPQWIVTKPFLDSLDEKRIIDNQMKR